MSHVATSKQLGSNYRNNGRNADALAIGSVQIAASLPYALNDLSKMSESERQNLATALRNVAAIVEGV